MTEKTVIITGAAGLLGQQYAMGLSQLGANIVLADMDYSKCKQISKQLNEEFNTNSFPIKVDISNKKSVKNLTNQTMKKYSKIDVLINNAAYQGNDKIRTTKFVDLPISIWNKAISVNLTGMFLPVTI